MLFIEAEQFDHLGGWALDQQFMDIMGSPYLLAHGLGTPVADAVTRVAVPRAGTYRLWVRTKDWVGTWCPDLAPESKPGRFQILVNGRAVPVDFGVEGAAWHWQDGGRVDLPAGDVSVALHDLTGFDGRCDALLFSHDEAFCPPDDGPALAAFRRKALGLPAEPEDGGTFDFVIAGAGIAGICAAVAAARLGLTVALINDRDTVGGNNSSEIRVNVAQNPFQLDPFPHVGDLTHEIEPHRREDPGPRNHADNFEDARKLAILRAEPNITLLTGQRVVAVEKNGAAVAAVVVQDIHTAQRTRVRGAFFADCTGDGDVGFLAGADHDMNLTNHMGPTNVWNVRETEAPAPFPRCPWAIDLTDKPFPGRGDHVGQWGKPGLGSLGQWFWENGFDFNSIDDAERIRDTNLRAMFGAWDALKNVDGLYPNHRIVWAAFLAGKRESRRLFGDVIVKRGDLFRQRAFPEAFPDACVPCTWHMDLHVPHKDFQPGFEGEEFVSWCVIAPFPQPFWLPYRALYSRNIPNLFMAGRDISVTHEALGGVRVMRTTGMMGEVIGQAAYLCRTLGTDPRGIYTDHLERLLDMLRKGGLAKT